MPKRKTDVVQLPITIPLIKGAVSPVFTIGEKITNYRVDDLRKQKLQKNTNRVSQYSDMLVALFLVLDAPVPYRFCDEASSLRSHDAGCLGHLYNSKPRYVEFVLDEDGFIVGVVPTSDLIDKHLTGADFIRKNHFKNLKKNIAILQSDQGNDNTLTSEHLSVGEVYSRDNLRDKFGITDATVNTGIFQPKGHSSIWLFVTEQKTKDRIQYVDHLDGDVLNWQGQTAGRKDKVIITHEARGQELLLFHRQKKYEHPGAAFRYEGIFSYVNHSGAKPSSFVLRRVSSLAREVKEKIQQEGDFDPADIEDARRKTLTAIFCRSGQKAFRDSLLRAYSGRCAISGCDVPEALEAAHIYPYKGDQTNSVANGILLRADFHTLFDLGLIGVDPDRMRVVISRKLQNSDYQEFAGRVISLPASPVDYPSNEALKWHVEQSGLK